MDIDIYLQELKTIVNDNLNKYVNDNVNVNVNVNDNDNVNEYTFTISELKKYIDDINLKASNELKLKLLEENSYLTIIDYQLVFNETKIIKKLKSSEYELTSDQDIVLDLIGKFLLSSKNIFGLYGYAGTGKTTLITQIVTNLVKNNMIKKIAIVAPTNKALSVIKTKFADQVKKIIKKLNISTNETSFDMIIECLRSKKIILDFITIHRLLQLKVDYDDSGEIIYVTNKKTLISDYELIIIDESSMVTITMIDLIINSCKVNRGVNREINKNNTKIIFAGDPAQLPPINEKISAIFLKNYDELTFHKFKDVIIRDKTKNVDVYTKIVLEEKLKNRYENFMENLKNIESYILKEVMRSKKKNVIKTCLSIRHWIDNRCELPAFEKFNGKKGIQFYNYQGQSKLNEEWFKIALEDFKISNENNIILTWTNSQSNEYNTAIRTMIYNKKNLKRFEIGDILILNDFYNFKNQESKISTSEQMKIISERLIKLKPQLFGDIIDSINFDKFKNAVSLKKKVEEFISNTKSIFEIEYSCHELIVFNLTDNDHINLKIYILTTEYQQKYNMVLKEIQLLIKKFITKLLNLNYTDNQVDIISKPMWKNIHVNLIEPFATVSYGYSITCHKAQGSNFYNVYVDANDIMKNIKENEMKKCLYTAFTRTINNLKVLI
jgi:hypothetical protein